MKYVSYVEIEQDSVITGTSTPEVPLQQNLVLFGL